MFVSTASRYNVGDSDYLPTWRWWFASKLLGRTAADVPAAGLEAQLHMGRRLLRRFYHTHLRHILPIISPPLQDPVLWKKGDVITFSKFETASGSTDLDLVLSAVGSEGTGVSYNLCEKTQISDDEEWVEKKFTVGSDFGKDLALVALRFKNSQNLDLLLGEFSIVRGTYAAPATQSLSQLSCSQQQGRYGR